MNIQEVIEALERVRSQFEEIVEKDESIIRNNPGNERELRLSGCTGGRKLTKGGYFRVGNVAVKIAEITELK